MRRPSTCRRCRWASAAARRPPAANARAGDPIRGASRTVAFVKTYIDACRFPSRFCKIRGARIALGTGKQMRNRATVRALSIAALAVVGGLAVPAAAAHATASDCHSQRWNGSGDQDGWQAKCDTQSNPGKDLYRAVATCSRDTNPSVKVTVYGGWVGGVASGWSIARCASNYSVVSGRYETGSR
ncbi:hypothetical protein Adi01nite_01530 [Amorphoplanes digitatis]|nr:hypothetical protein Adi01nite_01530 [Actinoplanes digitatis]